MVICHISKRSAIVEILSTRVIDFFCCNSIGLLPCPIPQIAMAVVHEMPKLRVHIQGWALSNIVLAAPN